MSEASDPTEKRDWDVPSTAQEEAAERERESEGAGEPQTAGEQPAEESERRDWDLP